MGDGARMLDGLGDSQRRSIEPGFGRTRPERRLLTLGSPAKGVSWPCLALNYVTYATLR